MSSPVSPPGFHGGPHEGLDRRGRVVVDRGEAQATGASIEILGTSPSRLGLVAVALDHLDGTGDQDFSSIDGLGARLEERVADPKRDLRPIDLDDAFEKIAVRVD